MKKERESIGTAGMHPMALAHHKGQKMMKKAIKKARSGKKAKRYSKEDMHHAYKHMKEHGG